MKKIFFFKRLQKFFLLMFAPMVALCLVFSANMAAQVFRELRDKSMKTVSNVDTNLGQVITGAVEQNKILSANVRMSMAFRHALIDYDALYGDILYLDSLRLMLYSMVNSYDYLESSYIYLFGAPRIISSENGLQNLVSVKDKGWIEVCDSMAPWEESCIKTRIYGENGVNEHLLLTICQRMPLHDGCIVLNMNVEKLQNMMDSLRLSPQEEVFIIDGDGTVLCSRESSIQKREGIDAAACAKRLINENGWKRIDGQIVQITSIRREKPDCYVVSVLPLSAFWSRMAEQLLGWVFVFIAMAVIIVIIAYYVTARSFANISAVMDMFDNAEKGLAVETKTASPKDEYEVILNNIVGMFINNSYLQLQLKEKQFKQENAELMALQLQINPHFLYNTLQTLDMEVKKVDDSGSVHVIIRYVSNILKYALDQPEKPVLLKEELSYLKDYARIQEYRFGNFIIYYEIEPDTLDAQVFRLMLQPVLENSLIHGIRNLGRKGYVKIGIRRKDNRLNIRMADNGHGMSKEALTELRQKLEKNEGSNIGLMNLNRRLILRYGEESRIRIHSKENLCTVVFFSIPYMEMPPSLS